MKIGILQMCSGIDPERNAATIVDAIRNAANSGAQMLFTPEMSGLLDRDKKRAARHVVREDENALLSAATRACAQHGIYLALGSLAIEVGNEKWANRSFVIDDKGAIVARYDKIHMFDVDLSTGESWRESNTYSAGDRVVTVDSPLGRLGLSVCYDIRFPALFEKLGRLRCDAIAIPAAFTVPTGKDHWHVLQRARAIESNAFVISAAQVGNHEDGRTTYGHSLVVDPWGEVLLDMGGGGPGLDFVELDMNRIVEVRSQLPSLANRRDIPQAPRP